MSRHYTSITKPHLKGSGYHRLWHFLLIGLAALLALLLAACAPGTGGTGTGPVITGTAGDGTFDKPEVPPAPTPTPAPAPAPGTGSPSSPPTVSITNTTLSQTLVFSAGGLASNPLPGSNTTTAVTSGFAGLGFCRIAENFSLPTLYFSAQGIEYAQDCYRFSYLGPWSFDMALGLSVKGTLINIDNPEIRKTAVLMLIASSALNIEDSSIKATLADENNQMSLPTKETRFLGNLR